MSHHPNNLTSPQGTQGGEPPRLGGIRLGGTLVTLLYVLLVASAGLSFFGKQFPGAIPTVLAQVTPWLFLAFLLCFAFYRLGVVQAGRYPAFKGFFQIGLGVAVLLLLLPGSRGAFGPSGEGLEGLLQHQDPQVRALAAEVAQYRPQAMRLAPALVRALEDPEPEVRAQAHASLVHIAGADLGDPASPAGLKAWRERFP